MHTIAVVLACLAWSVHGRRLKQVPIESAALTPSSYELGVLSGGAAQEGWQDDLLDNLKEALEVGRSQVTILFSMKDCPWCEQMLTVVGEAVERRSGAEPSVPPRGSDMLQSPLRAFVLDADDFPSVAAQFGAKVFPTTVVFGHREASPVMAYGYLTEENFDEMLRVAVLGKSAAVLGKFQSEDTAGPQSQSLLELKQEKSGFSPKKAFARLLEAPDPSTAWIGQKAFARLLEALNPGAAASKAASHEVGEPKLAMKKGWQEGFMESINEAIGEGTSQVAIIFSMNGCPWCDKMYTVAQEVVIKRSDAAEEVASAEALLSAPLRVFVLYAEEFPGAAQQFDVQGFPTIVAFGPQGAVKATGFLDEDGFKQMLSVAVLGVPEQDVEETVESTEEEESDEQESTEEESAEEATAEKGSAKE